MIARIVKRMSKKLEQDPDIILEAQALEKALTNNSISNTNSNTNSTSDINKGTSISIKKPYRFVKLGLSGTSYAGNSESAELLQEIGGISSIFKMTDMFYKKAFEDIHLDKFIRSHKDPHFSRLGNWIVEKMDPRQAVWTRERSTRDKCPVQLAGGHQHVVHDRSSAHAAAWYSPKRPREEVGEHFVLHDARVWMRLMFLSAKETGLFALSPTFEDWYIRFIGHFMRVYEGLAPQFARDSARWCENTALVEQYNNSNMSGESEPESGSGSVSGSLGCKMMGSDVLGNDMSIGVPLREALKQIPRHEWKEQTDWPYNKTQLPLR